MATEQKEKLVTVTAKAAEKIHEFMKEELTDLILKKVLLLMNTNTTYRQKAELIAELVIEYYDK